MSQGTPKSARKLSAMQRHPEQILTDLKKDSLLMPCPWTPSLQNYKTKNVDLKGTHFMVLVTVTKAH